jgi:hypothetical protein
MVLRRVIDCLTRTQRAEDGWPPEWLHNLRWSYRYVGTLPDGMEMWHWGPGFNGRPMPVLRAEDV